MQVSFKQKTGESLIAIETSPQATNWEYWCYICIDVEIPETYHKYNLIKRWTGERVGSCVGYFESLVEIEEYIKKNEG